MRMFVASALMIVLAATVGLAQEHMGWTQLSLSACQVDDFLRANPQSDGRGVVIAVLDTGVDPSIPGLTHTPDGAVKVVDLQDFTGDGDVELHWVRIDADSGNLIEYDDDGAPIEYTPPTVPPTPAGEERRWWFGYFREAKFANADLTDLNDNGTTDDEFPVLMTALTGDGDDQALAFVDTDLDRSFANEKPLRNYKLNYDTFTLHREQPEMQIRPMTFSVNIFIRQSKVVFCFDEGAHGTHVAGIAAGCEINNQPGFNGVAPGAKLIGLKIGKGAAGGISITDSMKEALNYAARYAREHNVPVVCNLSYGVESEIEGNSDVDKLLDDVLEENPYLVFCSSAGNSGPGLSSVGTPAAASQCFTIGALMASDTGRDVAGWSQDDAVVTTFSSRGGEMAKPDIVTPGWSTSTVPRHVTHGDFWAGTSMASPYAAGLCALVISDVLQHDPQAKVRACDVKRALCLSARTLAGMTPLDMGYGVPQMPRAAELMKKLQTMVANDPVIGYDISTECLSGYKSRSTAAYWRGLWFPTEDRQTFTISPVFAPTTDQATHTAFVRKFELRSLSPWCQIEQETVYLRSEQNARVFVTYDPEQLREPGLHVGVVEALHEGLVAFRLINTIIVPEEFTRPDNFTRWFKGQTADGWVPDRWFVAVPPGASAMHLLLRAPEGLDSEAGFASIYDPWGHEYPRWPARLDTQAGRTEIECSFSDDLVPGVWELPVVANRPDKTWPYDLRVRFFGLQAEPSMLTDGGATRPSGDLTVTNMFPDPVPVRASGAIEGFRKHDETNFRGLKDTLSYPISLDGRFNRLRIRLEMAPEAYATTTDIAVIVKDASGEPLSTGAFDWRVFEDTVSTRGNGSVTVEIIGGFAVSDDKRETPITVDIDQLFSSPVSVSTEYDGSSSFVCVPGIPILIEWSARESLDDIPGGTRPVGYLEFEERGTDDVALRVPIDIGG